MILFVWYKHRILCPALSFSGCPHCVHRWIFQCIIEHLDFIFYSSNIGIGWYWKSRWYKTWKPWRLKTAEVHHAVWRCKCFKVIRGTFKNPFQTPEAIHFILLYLNIIYTQFTFRTLNAHNGFNQAFHLLSSLLPEFQILSLVCVWKAASCLGNSAGCVKVSYNQYKRELKSWLLSSTGTRQKLWSLPNQSCN